VNISVPASHQTKKTPSKADTSHSLSQGWGGGQGEGVTAPNKYHMPKQLAPPNLLVETFKIIKHHMGGGSAYSRLCLRAGWAELWP